MFTASTIYFSMVLFCLWDEPSQYAYCLAFQIWIALTLHNFSFTVEYCQTVLLGTVLKVFFIFLKYHRLF